MKIVIASGKGGTGKTSIVASFAGLAKNAMFADCDVDAADLHLVLEPTIKQKSNFSGGKRAVIIAEKCSGCGKCQELCRFDAIHLNGEGNDLVDKTFTIDPISCEGCKVCVEFCPVDAIEFNDSINGQWFISDTRLGPMVHAKLGIAEENSGKLVTLIRKEAKRIAAEEEKNLIITEPTLSGKHDLDRVADLAASFGIPTLLCINKSDLNQEITGQITEEAGTRGIKLAGKIRYDKAFTKAQILKATVIEYIGGRVSEEIKTLWRNVIYALA